MATHFRIRGGATTLKGRRGETQALDQLLEAIRSGASRALVVHGEPGIGKTALLEYLVGRAAGCRVARAAGVESEMELAFAGLHQLLAPMLDLLEHLPIPQREALRVAFGLSPGSAWSMMRSGSIARRRRSSPSSRAASGRSRSGWSSRRVCRATSWGDCRSSRSRVCARTTRASCWTRRSPPPRAPRV